MNSRARQRAAVAPAARVEAYARAGIGDGRPLDHGLRAEMERSFGHDLGAVRIHADTRADRAARRLGAQAYTLGEDIVVSGRHAPLAGRAGRELLSHELAHVVQQRQGGERPGAGHEAAADAAAQAALAGRPTAAQPGAGLGVQRRIEVRSGSRLFSGMPRMQELVDRLNRISTALIFDFRDGVLSATPNPYGDETEFDRQMARMMNAATVIPLRLTNRNGMARYGNAGPYNLFVDVDDWVSGLVDIDDLLASDDLTLQTNLVHVLRERQTTPNYNARMGTAGLDPVLTPASSAEFLTHHDRAIGDELAILQDYFGDLGIRTIDLRQRIFRSSRGDIIRSTEERGRGREGRGILETHWQVTIRGTGERMTGEQYRDLLRRERAAAVAPPPPAGLNDARAQMPEP